MVTEDPAAPGKEAILAPFVLGVMAMPTLQRFNRVRKMLAMFPRINPQHSEDAAAERNAGAAVSGKTTTVVLSPAMKGVLYRLPENVEFELIDKPIYFHRIGKSPRPVRGAVPRRHRSHRAYQDESR